MQASRIKLAHALTAAGLKTQAALKKHFAVAFGAASTLAHADDVNTVAETFRIDAVLDGEIAVVGRLSGL